MATTSSNTFGVTVNQRTTEEELECFKKELINKQHENYLRIQEYAEAGRKANKFVKSKKKKKVRSVKADKIYNSNLPTNIFQYTKQNIKTAKEMGICIKDILKLSKDEFVEEIVEKVYGKKPFLQPVPPSVLKDVDIYEDVTWTSTSGTTTTLNPITYTNPTVYTIGSNTNVDISSKSTRNQEVVEYLKDFQSKQNAAKGGGF